MGKKDEFISLKDAAKLTGYSADYIGQLIRSGKIDGQQMYTNISWVTTEKAVLEYLDKSKKDKAEKKAGSGGPTHSKTYGDQLIYLLRFSLWAAAIFLACLILFLSYVFFVTLDRSIEQKTLDEYQYEG